VPSVPIRSADYTFIRSCRLPCCNAPMHRWTGVPLDQRGGLQIRYRNGRLITRACGASTPTAPGGRLTGAEYVGRRQVVPTATLTDLDDVYLELGVFRSHFVKFSALLDSSLVAAKLIAVDVS